MAKTVTLWYFEFCTSNIGVWDRVWATSRTALEKKRREMKRTWGSRLDDRITPDEEMDGSYGQHGRAHSVEVELSAKGILGFAQDYGVDDGAC